MKLLRDVLGATGYRTLEASTGHEALALATEHRNRKLARDVLRAAQFPTLEAGTAAEAIALALEHRPDVILMDLRLPDLDGTEAARLLKAEPRTSDIPVVAVTALRLDASETWFSGAGLAGYILKPLDADELPELVRGFCARGATASSFAARPAPRLGCQHPGQQPAGTIGARSGQSYFA